MSKSPHSAAVLTDLRDRWWSTDFLTLMVSRLGLEDYKRVADLGCGHGHWGQRILPLLATSATITGIDQEEEWVERARARAVELGLGARCHYRVGTAEDLPFEDGSFDLVTCQTLLMHVADVRSTITEMLRVLRPGGRLLLVEPNNVAQQFIADSVNRCLTPRQLGDMMNLFTACSRGRDRLGRGDDCIDDRLPSLLEDLSLDSIVVFQNERVGCILPPYDETERAQLQQSMSYADRGFWLWDKADARLLYEAGGGDLERYETSYSAFAERTELFRQQVEDGSYACNNASLAYLVSATRPVAKDR